MLELQEQWTCNYGDRCSFNHVEPNESGANKSEQTSASMPEQTSEVKPEKLRLCRFQKNGKCMHRDNCRWSHDLASEQPPQPPTVDGRAARRVMSATHSKLKVAYSKECWLARVPMS